MPNLTESGHAKNVANFNQLVAFTAALGQVYNPSKDVIKQSALEALATAAEESLKQVNTQLPIYNNAVAARSASFEPLAKLATRALNALRSTDTTEQVDNSARALVRKIQGVRASSILTEEEKKQLEEAGKSTTQISASQTGFDNRLDNFHKLIALLESIPQYVPNEEDLKIASLKSYYETLKNSHQSVMQANITLSQARVARNEILYKPLSGMVDLALDTKTYLKAVYGANDPRFKQISSLSFRTVNN